MEELIATKGKLDNETISKYRQLEKALIDALRNTQQILLALGHTSTHRPLLKDVPMIDDLRTFLRDYGKPAHQYEIIRAVGDVRKRRSPDLTRPYLDVWKSLVFHDRHDREIVAVEIAKDGIRRTKLKQREGTRLPRKPLGGDSAEHYREPDNMFWFLNETVGKPRR